MTVKQKVRCDAMRVPARLRRALLAGALVAAPFAFTGAPAAAAGAAAAPSLAYVTETASSAANVWILSAAGGAAALLGPGEQPLLAPDGRSVAVALFGAGGETEKGPSIGIYPAGGGPAADFLDLATATATPLAWSPDSRYLAVYSQSNSATDIAPRSGLDVIDTHTGAVTPIAKGAIYGASFARDGSDRIVFGLTRSLSLSAKTNLYIARPDGTGLRRLTSDGRSLNPVWGPRYIAYDREHLRRYAPAYQIWLTAPGGGRIRRVTNVPAGPLVAGLVPLAFSADGRRLLAEFEGQDTSAAWAVNVSSGDSHEVTVHGRAVLGAGISSDGRTLLIDENAFEQAPSSGRVATIPFAGGRSKVIVAHGAQASWND